MSTRDGRVVGLKKGKCWHMWAYVPYSSGLYKCSFCEGTFTLKIDTPKLECVEGE